jgi:hypothetical protein
VGPRLWRQRYDDHRTAQHRYDGSDHAHDRRHPVRGGRNGRDDVPDFDDFGQGWQRRDRLDDDDPADRLHQQPDDDHPDERQHDDGHDICSW